MKRILLPIILLAWACAAQAAPAQGEVTIYRDRYGVPSIEAGTLPDAAYGLGYCMAQDAAEPMARAYKLARGRIAEVDGPGSLVQDTLVRALGVEETAAAAPAPGGENEAVIRAFCDGANRSLAEQKGTLPAWIEPFTPTDVLSVVQIVNLVFPLLELRQQLFPGIGSNQFAVSAKRSASGHAILSADPHLDWGGPVAWYEYAFYIPGVSFRGVTGIGLPFGGMGHTQRVAWCMTNNNPDLADLYTVETNPANPNQYNYHGEWRDFQTVELDMRFRAGDTLQSAKQTVRRTAWGPVVPLTNNAVRVSPQDPWDSAAEFARLFRAKDVHGCREALRGLGASMWNIVFADTGGNIAYQYNARVSHRDEALDWSKPVSGSDVKTKWGAFWTIDELPHAENPASGLLVNANSSPWLTCLGPEIRADGWPRYVTSYGATTRWERLSAVLSQDRHITVEKARRYATDTEVPHALKAIRELQRAAGPQPAPAQKEALDVLAAWNGRADLDARGCGLYSSWIMAGGGTAGLAAKAARGEAWTPAEATSALAALEKAAADMKRLHGRLNVPWGEMHVSRRGQRAVPVTGWGYLHSDGRTVTGAAVVPNSGDYKGGRFECDFGSSFRMIAEMDPAGPHSWTAMPFGTSSDPRSPHYTDQMEMFGRGEYKDTHFGLADARAQAESRVVLRR